MPIPERVEDPVVVTEATDVDGPGGRGDTPVDKRPLRVAVMSDVQFVAANPDSSLVAGTRRTLREVLAAQPDLLLDLRANVAVGEAVDASATIVQGDRVPVAWPVTDDWRGPRLSVGDPDDAGPRDVAAQDLITGELVGLPAGTTTVQVTVNKSSATRRVTID